MPRWPVLFPVLCDLDGVVWLSHRPIPGAPEAVARLRSHGHRVLFVTNNSFARLADHERVLADIGIPAAGDVLSSALAAAELVEPAERAMVCGGPGVVEALERRGVHVVTEGPADAVLVGWHRTFDFDALTRAVRVVLSGARLIGTNDDPTYPTPDGPLPGGGALLAAVATASGAVPIIAGKPHEAMVDLVRREIGVDGLADAVMVGDRPSTDGRFARRIGCRYAHVWSGVTSKGAPVDPRPDLVGDDLADIACQLAP